MLTLEIFKQVLLNTSIVPSVLTAFMFLQGGLTGASEIFTFYRSIKTHNVMLKIGLCLIPSVFILFLGFMAPVQFGSFIAGGTEDAALYTIVSLVMSQRFWFELAVAVVVWVLLAVLYCKRFRLRWPMVLITFGLETVVVILWLVAAGGVFISGFPVSLFSLVWRELPLFHCLVYGYYILAYKTLLTLICIVTDIMFKDRGQRKIDREYFMEGGDYETAVIQYLNYRQKAVGGVFFCASFFLFGLGCFCVMDDMGLPFQLSSLWNIFQQGDSLLLLIMMLFSFLASISILFFSCFPRFSPAYHKLKKHNLFQLFYEEVAVNYPKYTPSGIIETEHFRLRQSYLIGLKIK